MTAPRPLSVNLTAGGMVYAPWDSLVIERSLGALCGSWAMTSGQPRPGQPVNPIQPGTPVVIRDGADVLLTGTVDDVDGDSGTLTALGRDLTADLVDCTVAPPCLWTGSTPLQIAADIASPFGLDVIGEGGAGASPALERFACWPWERAADVLARLCALAGVVPYSSTAGALVLTRGGSGGNALTALIEGVNCKVLGYTASRRPRAGSWTAYGQAPATMLTPGAAGFGSTAGATDPGGGEARTSGAWIDGPCTFGLAGLAIGQRATAALAGYTVRVSVASWRQTLTGPHWTLNQLVPFTSTTLGLSGETMLIIGLRLEDGAAELTLARRDTYGGAITAAEIAA